MRSRPIGTRSLDLHLTQTLEDFFRKDSRQVNLVMQSKFSLIFY
jgi:hypothetical protein